MMTTKALGNINMRRKSNALIFPAVVIPEYL